MQNVRSNCVLGNWLYPSKLHAAMEMLSTLRLELTFKNPCFPIGNVHIWPDFFYLPVHPFEMPTKCELLLEQINLDTNVYPDAFLRILSLAQWYKSGPFEAAPDKLIPLWND